MFPKNFLKCELYKNTSELSLQMLLKFQKLYQNHWQGLPLVDNMNLSCICDFGYGSVTIYNASKHYVHASELQPVYLESRHNILTGIASLVFFYLF